MGIDDLCQTGLGLVLQLGISSSLDFKSPAVASLREKKSEPSLSLSLSGEPSDQIQLDNLYGQDSAASSSVKREREGEEAVETDRISSRMIGDDDDDGSNGRKKLRLTKAQSALLEESFKRRSTLNPKLKQDLARDLKLRPRQVEVWFQNRRARTKLKQTEIDCEFLRKCCESLADENRRLQKELQELKSPKPSEPLYMQLPAATLAVCPSCEETAAAKTAFTMAPKFTSFTNQSAAC
ncbi:homeobox-leucine zipper protein HAT22-like [Andrographis paniculata]|uniref:homeobox-leucine zipper protein HAT22-like n=1 Tax=Andrographis paniculata TaxID=175694 RepID=UPI0021E72607|nr:homeobox-leucine zipper protein HAT22-like [Andrographis paniculata]